MRRFLATIGVLVLLVVALSLAGAATAPPGSPAASGVAADRGASLAPNDEAVCGVEPQQAGEASLVAAVGPHCCGTGAAAACRDQCKLQGPACKGAIGCRAGECVCTCTCP